jgi:hypothetical protein
MIVLNAPNIAATEAPRRYIALEARDHLVNFTLELWLPAVIHEAESGPKIQSPMTRITGFALFTQVRGCG